MIPDSVVNYYDAQWWVFIHWVLPVAFLTILAIGFIAWLDQTYYDDED